MDKSHYKSFNQKELLYNPNHWGFWAFLLTPILPAIFYYRNCKVLKKGQGSSILVGTIIYTAGFITLSVYFPSFSSVILLAQAIIAIIIAKKIGKTQINAYNEMKKNKGINGGRNEIPMAALFLLIILFLFFSPTILAL